MNYQFSRAALVCAAFLCTSAFAEEKSLYKISNQQVLEDTVSSLSVSSAVKTVVPQGSSIVIRNIEDDRTSDRKIVALFEDQMIADFISAGYKVLERDANAIRRSIEEQGQEKYSIIKKQSDVREDEINSGNPLGLGLFSKRDNITIETLNYNESNGDNQLLLTHLEGADYIINYRIQELGINYGDLKASHVKRSALARVHIRIEDAETGEILLARNIDKSNEDSVPTDMVSTLANYRYSQFYQGYPGQNADENNIYVYSDRRIYLQASLVTSFDDGSGSFGIKSPMQVGFSWGKDRLGFEVMSGTTKDGDISLKQSGSFLVYARKIVDFNIGSLRTTFYPEIGLGNADIQNKSKGVAKNESGTAAKVSLGIESNIHRYFDVRFGVDSYAVEKGNYFSIGSLALRFSY